MSSYPSTSSVNSTSTSQTTSLQAGQVPSYADEHDPSWEEVISMVVIPGQPGQIRDAAGNWEVLFSRIDQARSAIDQLSAGLQSWEGAAGEAYRNHLGELSGRVAETIEGNRGVVQQLHTAADNVDHALTNTPIPDELVDEVMAARDKFQKTGQLDTKFHPGWFGDLLFPGFLNIAGDIFGFLTFGLADKASDMLRDFLSDGDDKAKAAYQALSGQHSTTASAMPPAAGFLMDSLNPTTQWSGSGPGGTGAPSSAAGTGTLGPGGAGGSGPGFDPSDYSHTGTGLAGAGGGGPVSVSPPSTGSTLHPIGAGGGAAGAGGLGAGGIGGAGGIRPGGVTSAANAIKGIGGGMPGMGGMAGAGGAGARGGGVGGAGGAKPGGVPSARAGGMGGMGAMGGAHGGGAAGARAAGGNRTAVPGVGSAVAGGAGSGKGGAGCRTRRRGRHDGRRPRRWWRGRGQRPQHVAARGRGRVGHRQRRRSAGAGVSRMLPKRVWPAVVTVATVVAAGWAAPAFAASGQRAARAETLREAQWFLDAVHAPDAQGITKGAGVTVALIDSGVDATHPDLSGAVLPGVSFDSPSQAGRTDPDGHGTRMAGLIAARGGSVDKALGIAPAASILPIAIPATGQIGSLAEPVKYAVDHGAKVINLSIGRPPGRAVAGG
jgi:hypothetical protein